MNMNPIMGIASRLQNTQDWSLVEQAVHDECKRARIAQKFLLIHIAPEPGLTTFPSDTILLDNQIGNQEPPKLTVDETAVVPFIELEVQFNLTIQQLNEPNLSTAITLATRAANLLCQGEDIAIFEGQRAVAAGPDQRSLFADGKVRVVSGSAGVGLLNAPEEPGANPDLQVVSVPVLDPNETPPRWGENTFGAVSTAYGRLQNGDGLAQAHYGPYACVLNFQPYADSYAPLRTTLIIPADRIKPLVTEYYGKPMYSPGEEDMDRSLNDMYKYGRDMSYLYYPGYHPRYYGTGTISEFRGTFLSLGGNTMDLVIGKGVTVEFVQQIGNFYCYRVFERFALRLKDPTACIRLEFDGSADDR